MRWGIRYGDNFIWPDALDPKSAAYAKANKKGELNDIFHDLAAIQAEHRKFQTDIEFAPARQRNKETTDGWVQNITAFAGSANVKKLVGSLKIVGKRASTAAAKPKISSDAKKALQAIAKSANDHAAAMEPAKLAREIGQIRAELVKAGNEEALKRVGSMLAGLKAIANKGHPGIAEAKKRLAQWANNPAADAEEEAAAIGRHLYDDCRDMTTGLGNLIKAQKAGGDLVAAGLQQRDVVTLPGLTKTLTPFGNSMDTYKGKDRAQMQKILHTVDVNAKLFDTIASHIP